MPRPWKRPTIPLGPLGELNRALHELHHRAGWPSSREIRRALEAKGVLMSHTKVHDTLTKPVLPTKGAVEMITEVLAEQVRGADVNTEIDHLLGLWQDASMDAQPFSHATSEGPQGEASSPTAVEYEEEQAQSHSWGDPWQQRREKADSGDTGELFNLGILLEELDRTEEAKEWWQRFRDAGGSA